MTCLSNKHKIINSLCPQIIKQIKTGTNLCQDVNLSIHEKMKFLLKERRLNSPTNCSALKPCFVSEHERVCNLGHLGLSQSLVPRLSRAQSTFQASFISLFLFKTFLDKHFLALDNHLLPDGRIVLLNTEGVLFSATKK